MTIKQYYTNITCTSLFWGTIGGIALIIATILTTNGHLQITPYPILLIAAIVTIAVSHKKTKITLSKLFLTGFLTFMVMTLISYVYIITFVNPNSGINVLKHLLTLSTMIGIGTLSSLFVSLIIKQIVK